jgi:hydrogenase/urease accessory protein HupE
LTLGGDAAKGEYVSLLEFLKLGVEHIITGYDHLVFLFGLLIIGGRFKSIVTTVTAFTVAHSLTLSAATLEWVRLPATLVEPFIALSIVYVGAENLVRKKPPQRWVPAFGFGLIHGLGFASLLGDLGVGAPGSGIVGPLLCFNLGVEIGQIALAAIAMPIIWKLNRQPAFQIRWLPVCSILICLAGGYWLVERTLL